MRALKQPNPREWFKIAAGRAPYMQPGAYAQRRKSLSRQLRLMHFGQITEDRYRPGAAQILERAPVPGSFYRPRTRIAPYDVARVAYGPEQDRFKAGLLMMNRSTWNDHIRRAKTGWTAYKVEGLQFDHKYNAADPLSTYGSGTSFPVVWVPPIDGREPEELLRPAAPAPVVAAPPPKPAVPPPVVIRMPTMPVVVKRPPPIVISPPPPPVVVKAAPKPAAPPPVVTAPPVIAERPPITLPEIVISLPKKKGKESGMLPPLIVKRAPEPPEPEPIGPPEYPGEKKKSSALPLLAIAVIASQVL